MKRLFPAALPDMTPGWRDSPIRMVNTDDGWRIDEFHTAMYG